VIQSKRYGLWREGHSLRFSLLPPALDPIHAVFSGGNALGMGERTLRQTAVCGVSRSNLWPRHQSPARNDASRFGYEGLGGRTSAGAAPPLSDIPPGTQSVKLVFAIAQQARQRSDVLPGRRCTELFRRIGQRAADTPPFA
jgi:hypothetical protein